MNRFALHQLAWCVVVGVSCLQAVAFAQATKPNLLFIYVDDLNRDIDLPSVQTPNIDALASLGVRFTHAYASHPLCNPSRASLLTSLRTIQTEVAMNIDPMPQNVLAGIEYLPHRLKTSGYYTYGLGKIFQNQDSGSQSWNEFYSYSDDPCPHPTNPTGSPDVIYGGPYMNGPNDGTASMRDTKCVKKSFALIEQAKARIQATNKPFAMFIGLQATHAPFIYPQRFASDYTDQDVPPLPNEELLGTWKNAVSTAAFESPSYYDPNWGATEDRRRLEARKAYFRCIKYVDEQVGLLRSHLHFFGLENNTIIVFVGDHGFSFSEHGHIGKLTGFEQDAAAPLIIAAPKIWSTHGKVYSDVVEQIDIYPTIMQLLSLTPPSGLHGTSLSLILNNLSTPHGPVFFTTASYHGMNLTRYVVAKDAVTGDLWKLGAWENAQDVPPVHQLYNLTTDLGEFQNLYSQPGMGTKIVELRQLLLQEGMLGASSRAYGAGLDGSYGIPTLSASGPPTIGQSTNIAISNSAGCNTIGVFVVGLRGQSTKLFCGLQWTRADYAVDVAIPTGGAVLPLAIPNLPALHEVPVGLQLLEADAGAPCGVSMSRGLELFLSQ